MSAYALTLVITAAFLHAGWNYLLKKCGGGIGELTLSAIVATTMLTPFSLYLIFANAFVFTPAMIGVILGSGVLHMIYFLLLDRAYRSGGDLSVVYPLARATGPLLTIIVATLVFGERMSALGAADKGGVGSRLSPALPHQTVRAVLPHTAFRCSSRQACAIFQPATVESL